MALDVESDLKLEIAHVLTIDIVAYSTLLIHEQSQVMRELNRIVRNAPRFRSAETDGKLTRLPTGDGMVLVFFGDPEAPVECAMQITAELKTRPEIRVRMGIHSGPINQVLDVNDRSNVAGAGIDMAQRVMDCGDAGHILVTKRVADDLAPYDRWHRHLHDLGECEVKHGRRIAVFNFYTDALGNPQLPLKFQTGARPAPAPTKSRRKYWLAALVVAALALAAALAFWFWPQTPLRRTIAVLPFIDLSQAKDQEYFSDGISEQIINSLGKIHGLFVLARSSSFSFKGKNEDARLLGRKLGVNHILEGSVNRTPGHVRINVDLIEVESGYQLWAENYDFSEQDALSVQSDVARKVASALELRLQLKERTELAKVPTQDPEAYDLYLRGHYLLEKRTPDSIQKGMALLQEAVKKDPGFALGRAGIADAYILLGKVGAMRGPDAAAAAWPEATMALRLDPQLADAYVARAILLNDFEWNWRGAEEDFEKALALDPNNADAHQWYARHLAQFGRAKEALQEITAAQAQDPLSAQIRVSKAKIHFVNHHDTEAADAARKAIDLEQDYAPAYSQLAQALMHQGQSADGIAAAKKFADLALGTGYAKLELAYAYAVAGARAESDQVVAEVKTSGAPFSPYDMATICAAWHD
ncbi:MAG: tetratricopeptide repeat protein, partial [Verrucomicrobiota bacterium]|nr:tetratricopeptide repeat protein [Verrucomicrobiota bacterium]